ncbi:DUF2804 domain-containing protein [uncultured Shewanella sp.]|uniref:DUF2804 domain-containing protein n=1 Tax=uncultured Shewanella sp. TaxID=173975 RepID=UPI002612FD13|nr:DUF2804 domain-containing protein [uncultured Shewanella sp.]
MPLSQIIPSVPVLGAKNTPDTLINHTGEVAFGYFDGPVKRFGIEDFYYLTSMDKCASKLSKHFDFKQFQFVSVVTPEFIIAVAIADIRYLGSAFCYFYDVNNDKIIETQWLKLGSVGYQMSSSPMNGSAFIRSHKGELTLLIEEGQWHLKVKTARLSMKVNLCSSVLSSPLVMCTPTGYSGWTYTQKHNGLNVTGDVSIDNRKIPLNDALASYDFSAGFMRRETSWRWGSINACLNGDVFGINLAAGVNETGANENCFWINGERHLLPPVHFDFIRQGAVKWDLASQKSWRIYSANNQVNLVFIPKNVRREKLNLFFLKSNFRQYVGHYSGTVVENNGRIHQLNHIMGLAEDHFAKW